MMIQDPDKVGRLPDSAPSIPGVIQRKPTTKPVVRKPVPKKKPAPKPMAPVAKKVGAPVAKPMAPVAKKVGVPVKKAAPKAAPKAVAKPTPTKIAPKPGSTPVPRPVTPAIPRPPSPGGPMTPGAPTPAPTPTPTPAPPPPPRWANRPGSGLVGGLDLSQFENAGGLDLSGLLGGGPRAQARDMRGPSNRYVASASRDHDAEQNNPASNVMSTGYDPGAMMQLNAGAAREMTQGLVGSAAQKGKAYSDALVDAQKKFAASVKGGAQVVDYNPNVSPEDAAELAGQSYGGAQDLSDAAGVDFNTIAQAALEAERAADLTQDTGGLMELLSQQYGAASPEDAALAAMFGRPQLSQLQGALGDATGQLSDVFDASRAAAVGADSAVAGVANKWRTQPTTPLPPLPQPAMPVGTMPPTAKPPVALPPQAGQKPKPAPAPKPKAPAPKKPAPKPVVIKKPAPKKPKQTPALAKPKAPAPAQSTKPKAPSQTPTKPVYSPAAGTGINEPGDGSYMKPRRFPFL